MKQFRKFKLSLFLLLLWTKVGKGGLRGERNWSVFDPVYPVILTVHSAFRKASTCDVTPPKAHTHILLLGFFKSEGKSSQGYPWVQHHPKNVLLDVAGGKQDRSSNPAGSPNKDRSFQALTELRFSLVMNTSLLKSVSSHLKVQMAKLNGTSHCEINQVWEQDKLLHSSQTGWR